MVRELELRPLTVVRHYFASRKYTLRAKMTLFIYLYSTLDTFDCVAHLAEENGTKGAQTN